MSRALILVCVGIIGVVNCSTTLCLSAQVTTDNGNKTLRQTREELASLPLNSNGQSATGFRQAGSQATGPQSNFSLYRPASAQTGVYQYPASGPPSWGSASRANYGLSRNTAQTRIASQMSLGSNTSTGNLGSRMQPFNQPPVYNLKPTAAIGDRTTLRTNSRTPVEQQTSSTIPQRQNVQRQNLDLGTAQANSLTAAQQAQAQAMQLARQAQAQQAEAQQTLAQAQLAQARAAQIAQATQPTIAYRQSVYQQPTLGLGGPQARTAQNCNCAPAYNPTNYNPTAAAYQTPSLNPTVGSGLAVPPLNVQLPGQTGINQPALPQTGQFYCQPNYQVPSGLGTPQFGAQGARWWTPFVSGSGVYSPLIKLQNMPVGTYLGQGLIGQPTAYVDGQPVRNLLRYFSP